MKKQRQQNRKRVILIPLLIILVSGLIYFDLAEPAAAQKRPIELSLSLSWSETGINYEGLKHWVAAIHDGTGGRVNIVPYFNSSLSPASEAYNAAQSGITDIAMVDSNMLPGMFPMQEIWSQILPSTPWTRWSRIQWEIFNKFPQYKAEMPPIKILFGFSYGPATLATVKKPVRSLEDAKGLKLIVIGKVSTEVADALGFAPVPTYPPEWFTTMEKGVADGMLLCRQTFFYEYSLDSFAKYVTDIHVANTPFFFAMNMDKWNSLPPDIQQVFEKYGGEWAADYLDDYFYKTARKEGPAMMKEKFGTEFISLPSKELARWDDRVRPLTDAFLDKLEAKGLPAKAVFEEYNRLAEKYKY